MAVGFVVAVIAFTLGHWLGCAKRDGLPLHAECTACGCEGDDLESVAVKWVCRRCASSWAKRVEERNAAG